MTRTWPGAGIATLVFDPALVAEHLPGRPIAASFLQRTRPSQENFRRLLPFFRVATERLPLGDRRLVISSSSAFAHGIAVSPEAVHVNYCHSPFRYAWHEQRRALDEVPWLVRLALRPALRAHRRWDRAAARRITAFVANSEITRRRIRELWGRESTIVHPPVDVERFVPGTPEDYLLVVGEVTAHKRTELALAAAARARIPIKIVGSGPAAASLAPAYPRAEFLGRVDDDALAGLYARARAVVIPNVEEFGIVAVEAQAAGRPVIAAAAGGALETIVPERTGLLFPPDDADALRKAMTADFDAFDSREIREHAAQFAPGRFRVRLLTEVIRACEAAGHAELGELARDTASVGRPNTIGS